ncbi:hypothetical protein BRADI_5g06799v3 [Brachypodium distachyon]|uniref:Uncharacterized protein n=1 Tax=Brachypodium distachyon TaxID=15368 RepID=A0A0Q3P0F9_BRADI|nr:hypothetical protein BRADI_5g06799v3 [Brachypodium distachyon]
MDLMDHQVQHFVTLRFGDLWLNVPIGPLVASVSESWRAAAASRKEPDQEKEISSVPREEFTPVLSKSTKRRLKAANKKAASLSAAKASATQQAAKTTPISVMKRNVAEVGQSSHQQPKDKGRSVAFNKSEFPPLVCKGKEKMVEKSTCKQLGKRGDVAAILPFASSSTGRPTNARNILRADAPEFIPSLVHKPTLSNPLSEDAPVMRGSCEGSFDLVRHQRRQRNARRSQADLPAAVDQAAANRQRSHVSKSVKGRWEDTRPRMRVQNHDDSSHLPGASTSRNDVGGAIMRQAEALAKRPEYKEFIQRHPERRKRAAYKERERAVRARPESSRTQGAYTASSSQNSARQVI